MFLWEFQAQFLEELLPVIRFISELYINFQAAEKGKSNLAEFLPLLTFHITGNSTNGAA